MAEEKSVRYITKAELELHDIDHEEQWTLIDGKIIDITNYKYQHPGGDEILLEHAGADGTDSFNSVGHSKEARDTMLEYVIGELHPDDAAGLKKSSSASSSSSTDSETAKNASGSAGLIKYILVPAIIFATAYGLQKFLLASPK